MVEVPIWTVDVVGVLEIMLLAYCVVVQGSTLETFFWMVVGTCTWIGT